MFSPENFYNIILQNHVTDDDLLLVPRNLGDKDLKSWIPLDNSDRMVRWWNAERLTIKYSHRPIWLYDQEPFFPSATDTIRQVINLWANKNNSEIIRDASFSDIVAINGGPGAKTINVPIWCHSELYSPEISELENNLFVPCYYWYHAFIARDWFRHWHKSKSLAVTDKTDRTYRFLLYARDFSGTRTYRKHLTDNLSLYRDSIKYQWNSAWIPNPEESAKIDIDDANIAGIHLVAETLFETTKIHLTEKVFKPMVMSQPFIIWGPPGTLRYLRSYGFQTFDGIWSEAYDLEPDHDRRMAMLLELVGDLARLDQQQYRDIYQRCLPILEHNRTRFFSERFMEDCWQEMIKNFDEAKAKSAVLKKQHPGGQICHLLGTRPELFKVDIFRNLMEKILPDLVENDRQILLKRYKHFNDL